MVAAHFSKREKVPRCAVLRFAAALSFACGCRPAPLPAGVIATKAAYVARPAERGPHP
jgi:hypothetical protein